jgi:transposase
MGAAPDRTGLLMDRAYEGDETRQTARELNYVPIVPPKSNREEPWEYNKELYKSRNVIERFFRRPKEFRRIFTRYDKLDSTFLEFIHLRPIAIMIK